MTIKIFPRTGPTPSYARWTLWGYVDEWEVAQACRVALSADITGSENVIIAAADTVMNRASHELMSEVFPGVKVIDDLPEFGTLLAIDKARRLLGYEPSCSWRDHVDG